MSRTVAAFCNEACAMAGVSHRVEGIDIGPARVTANPIVDNTGTMAALGCTPTPLRSAITQTLRWFDR
ncbi:MAG: hypothetical protein WDM89_07175 [Rhizomicrobium sp.]